MLKQKNHGNILWKHLFQSYDQLAIKRATMLGDRYVSNLRQKRMLKIRADEAAKKLEVGNLRTASCSVLPTCYASIFTFAFPTFQRDLFRFGSLLSVSNHFSIVWTGIRDA